MSILSRRAELRITSDLLATHLKTEMPCPRRAGAPLALDSGAASRARIGLRRRACYGLSCRFAWPTPYPRRERMNRGPLESS